MAAGSVRERRFGVHQSGRFFIRVAIPVLDAVKLIARPVVEVHITNIYKRTEQCQHSLISLAATGVICGLGANSYLLAIRDVAEALSPN